MKITVRHSHDLRERRDDGPHVSGVSSEPPGVSRRAENLDERRNATEGIPYSNLPCLKRLARPNPVATVASWLTELFRSGIIPRRGRGENSQGFGISRDG